MKYILQVLLMSVLAGCAHQMQPSTVQLTADFDEAAARAMIKKGENVVSGCALIRKEDGGVATCAGKIVELIPATAYADERISHIYGSTESGANSAGVFSFVPDPTAYQIARRATTCDSTGMFEFEGVADGMFYLVTEVRWGDGEVQEGINLMRRIDTQDGDKQEVVLTEESPDTGPGMLERLRSSLAEAKLLKGEEASPDDRNSADAESARGGCEAILAEREE